MIGIVDYDCGNLFSLKSSIAMIGQEAVVTGDPETLAQADRIILPGVGAFEDAMKKLTETGLKDAVIAEAKKGKPLLGICLGMQVLFDESHEYGVWPGLGLVKGKVTDLKKDIPADLKVPHIGWNALELKGDSPLFRYTNDGDYVYFVHSYYATGCEESTIAVTDYGTKVTAAVSNGNVFGCHFHPEKSGETGLKILKAFCEI